jgi:hypothetical protein
VLQIHTAEAFTCLQSILCSRPSRSAIGITIMASGPVYGRLRAISFRTSCRTGSNWLQLSFQLEGVTFFLELSCETRYVLLLLRRFIPATTHLFCMLTNEWPVTRHENVTKHIEDRVIDKQGSCIVFSHKYTVQNCGLIHLEYNVVFTVGNVHLYEKTPPPLGGRGKCATLKIYRLPFYITHKPPLSLRIFQVMVSKVCAETDCSCP